MKLFELRRHHREGATRALASLLAIAGLSRAAANPPEQQVLQAPSWPHLFVGPEPTCIPPERMREHYARWLTMRRDGGSRLQELLHGPERFEMVEICWTNDAPPLTVRMIHHDQSFNILIQGDDLPGFDPQYFEPLVFSYTPKELQKDQQMLSRLQQEAGGDFYQLYETMFTGAMTSVLDLVDSCNGLIRELAASRKDDGTKVTSIDSPTELRVFKQETYPVSCIWPGAPDYDFQVSQLYQQRCTECLHYRPSWGQAHPLAEAQAEFDKMTDVEVRFDTQSKDPPKYAGRYEQSLQDVIIVHKYETFHLDLDLLNPVYFNNSEAERFVYSWAKRADDACAGDSPNDVAYTSRWGGMPRYREAPCRDPDVLEEIRIEIQALCEPTVRALLADVRNHGLVLDRGVSSSLRIEVAEDGTPRCAPYEPPILPWSGRDECGFEDNTNRFEALLEHINADELTVAALENTRIVPASAVELPIDPLQDGVIVDGTPHHIRLAATAPDAKDGSSLPDVMSMLRIAHWAKAHPDEASRLHVRGLKGIVVDERRCYRGMLLEWRGIFGEQIQPGCLYQCDSVREQRWLDSLRHDMELLRTGGPQIARSLVDSARVAIDYDEQVWLLDFQGKHVPWPDYVSGTGESARNIVNWLARDLDDPLASDPSWSWPWSDEHDEAASPPASPLISPVPTELDPALPLPASTAAIQPGYRVAEASYHARHDVLTWQPGLHCAYPVLVAAGPDAHAFVAALGVPGVAPLSAAQVEHVRPPDPDVVPARIDAQLWSKRVGEWMLGHCGALLRQLCANQRALGLRLRQSSPDLSFVIVRDGEAGHVRCLRREKSESVWDLMRGLEPLG